mgnify:CR=1 FL=1
MPETRIVALAPGGGGETPLMRLARVVQDAVTRIAALEGLNPIVGVRLADGDLLAGRADGTERVVGSFATAPEAASEVAALAGRIAAFNPVTGLRVAADGEVFAVHADGNETSAGRLPQAPASTRIVEHERHPVTHQIIRSRIVEGG